MPNTAKATTRAKATKVANSFPSVDDIANMSKESLNAAIINGDFKGAPAEIMQAALDRLAQKGAVKQPKVIVAIRTFLKDGKKGKAGDTQELTEKSLRNILLVPSKRMFPKDENLAIAQANLWADQVLAGGTHTESWYKITKA
jgi:hypothetical protein